MGFSVALGDFLPILDASKEIVVMEETTLKRFPLLVRFEIPERDRIAQVSSGVQSSQIATTVPVEFLAPFKKGKKSSLDAFCSFCAVRDDIDIRVSSVKVNEQGAGDAEGCEGKLGFIRQSPN